MNKEKEKRLIEVLSAYGIQAEFKDYELVTRYQESNHWFGVSKDIVAVLVDLIEENDRLEEEMEEGDFGGHFA